MWSLKIRRQNYNFRNILRAVFIHKWFDFVQLPDNPRLTKYADLPENVIGHSGVWTFKDKLYICTVLVRRKKEPGRGAGKRNSGPKKTEENE